TTTQIIFRVIFSYVLVALYQKMHGGAYAVHAVNGVAWACLAGWVMMLVYELPMLRRQWKKSFGTN
nr:hypothetical protein [Treponema sp.]